MNSIDFLLHIVVFVALFSSLTPRRFEIRVFYDPIQDPNNYLKLKAKIGETIDIPAVCPQSKEVGPKFAVIYQVDSREEFDNCATKSKIGAFRILATFECEGSRTSQTAKLAINLVNYSPEPNHIEFEEGKEYYFISASDRTLHRSDRICDGFIFRFSITVETEEQQNDGRFYLFWVDKFYRVLYLLFFILFCIFNLSI